MSETVIPIPPDRQRCWISISEGDVSFQFTPALPDGPHQPTRTEIMAAGALVGIARALTGKGAEAVIHALAQFDRELGGRKRRG